MNPRRRKSLFLAVCTGPLLSMLLIHPAAAQDGTATINYANTQQRIDGFGASSAWFFTALTDAEADLFFSTTNGAGLSLLRTRIAPGGLIDDAEGVIAQQAVARGARVWSSPWSPAANFKDNGSINGGNYVDTQANNAAYAGQLANYVATMKNSYGVNLYAVSVQNEPDVQQTYESCQWTSAQIHDFVPWLSAQLTTAGVGTTKIMLPEDEFWQWNLSADTMNDANTANLVGVLAAHNYNHSYNQTPAPYPNAPTAVWETEHYFGSDDSITNGLQLAQEIHNFLTVGNASAYHYWWLSGSGNGSLANNTSNPAKRLFVMGNYSRFVRPNYYRIAATNSSGALVSAYKDPTTGNVVVVAANPTSNPINQTFIFTNTPTMSTMVPWVTSATLSLASQAPIILGGNSSFTYALPALSVVSFVTSTLNESFESQAVADGNFNNLGTGAPTGWSSSGVSNAVVALVNPGAADGRGYGGSPSGLDGNNYCQLFATSAGGTGLVYQDTGVKYQAGEVYHLTVAFGNEAGNFATGSTLCLLNSNLTVIASTAINFASLPQGSFTDVALNYTGTGSEGGNGELLVGISMPGTSGNAYLDFDNVRLVAVAPAMSNLSFESPTVADGHYTKFENNTAPTHWLATGVSNAIIALVNPSASDGRAYGAAPPGLDGNNYCQFFASGSNGTGELYQDSGLKFQSGMTYQLTAAFGKEGGTFATGSTMCLLNSNLSVIASLVINGASLTSGRFTDQTLTYTATGNEGGNGDLFVGFVLPSTAVSAFFDFDNVRLVASPKTYAAYQAQYFTSAQIANPAVSGPTADANGDGVSNLLAAGLGLSPMISATNSLPTVGMAADHLTLTYTRPHITTDWISVVEVSSDLATWQSGSSYTTQLSVSAPNSAVDQVTVQDNTPMTGNSPRFIRLKVTLP